MSRESGFRELFIKKWWSIRRTEADVAYVGRNVVSQAYVHGKATVF